MIIAPLALLVIHPDSVLACLTNQMDINIQRRLTGIAAHTGRKKGWNTHPHPPLPPSHFHRLFPSFLCYFPPFRHSFINFITIVMGKFIFAHHLLRSSSNNRLATLTAAHFIFIRPPRAREGRPPPSTNNNNTRAIILMPSSQILCENLIGEKCRRPLTATL